MASVKLTFEQAQVLKALATHHQAHCGLAAQLDDLEYLSLGRGQLVKTLHQLIDKKLVATARKRYQNPPARLNEYFLTKDKISFSVEEEVTI